MTDDRGVTDEVESLYENIGWRMVGDVTYDAQTSEDLRSHSAAYVSRCRMRVARHLPASGQRLLDMASGPVQYPEYLKYSEGFETRVCVDLSQRALDMAKEKLGARGEYHVGDFAEMQLEPVDAAVSLHTIYHIDKDRQEAVVRRLIAVTKPGGSIVIVYSNPRYFVSALLSPVRRMLKAIRPSRMSAPAPDTIYFHRHPLSWWKQFEDAGRVEIHPWRTFSTREHLALFPDNAVGEKMFAALFSLEERFPTLFRNFGCYPMIVIRKAQ